MALSHSNALMGFKRFRDLPEHLQQESAVIELCLDLYSAETKLEMLQEFDGWPNDERPEVSREPTDGHETLFQPEQ